jgi:hypothetical protein
MPAIPARRNEEIDMINTYAIALENGKIEYVNASSARQARIVFSRTHNERIVSVKVCRDA